MAPAVITVTTTADDITPNDGSVSLREAITAINAGNNLGDPDIIAQNPGVFGTNDAINFNIPGSVPFQINVGSDASAANIPLPQITTPMVINGASQPGFAGKPIVILNGASAGANANGLDIELGTGVFSAGVTVEGLVLNGFSANGIQVGADNVTSFATVANTITGNYIGTDAAGTAAVANSANGIFINGVDSNNIGTEASNNLISDNVISGNSNDGVLIQANANGVASGNVITGNFIGTNAAGTAALQNGVTGSLSQTGGSGVEIISASGNTVGGKGSPVLTAAAGAGNVISGNAIDGVHVIGTLTDPATVNVVEGNFVGVDGSGVVALGNARAGIEVSGAKSTSIGGNVVGANADGIELDNGAQNNIVQGNFSGVGANGTTQVGNTHHGIVLRSNDASAPPLGPGQPNEPGVRNNLIGGVGAGDGNTVAFNGSGGVAVFGNPVATNGDQNSGNTIEGNSIFQNGRSNPTTLLGIDLSNSFPFPRDDGVTPNDSKGHGAANDPNNFQNFPVLTSATPAGPGTEIRGSLSEPAAPNTTFRIEFFASSPDPSGGIAEGQFFLGSANVTTNGSGNASFGVTLPVGVGPGQKIITATATSITADPSAPAGQSLNGNTSEFSAGISSSETPNQAFVFKVYRDLLNRAPDPGGLATWTNLLNNEVPPAQVVLFIETDSLHEYYSDLVQSFYQFYLHRAEGAGDAPFAAGMVNSLAADGTIEQLRALFTSSPEYFLNRSGGTITGYVNAVYQDAFGTPNRVATDSGAAAFANALFTNIIIPGTLTPAQFSGIIFNSDEFRFDLVQSFYGKFLNRTGAPSEINFWAAFLKQGISDQNVVAGILGSAESFALSQQGLTALGLRSPASVLPDLYGPIFQNIPQTGRANINSLDVFRSPADPQPPNPDAANFGNTEISATLSPFAGALTPNSFDPRLTFDFNVINTSGHLTPDFTFRLTFAPPTPAGNTFNQVITLRLIQGNTTTTIAQYTYVGNQVIPPAAFANNITFPGDAVATGKFMAGVFDDPSFVDAQGISQFIKAPTNGFPRPTPVNPAAPLPTEAKNYYGPNANILGFTLEVPTTKLTTANPPLLGVWADSSINGTQVQRLGRPLIDGLLIPPVPRTDLSRGDRRTAFNLGSPSTDVANFRADMIAVLTSPNFSYQLTSAQAANLVDNAFGSTIVGSTTGLLPDVLTVDLSKVYTGPTAGFPNGRRFRDDVTDSLFNLISNGKVTTDNVADDNGSRITDGLDGSTIVFPYIGRPNSPPDGPNT